MLFMFSMTPGTDLTGAVRGWRKEEHGQIHRQKSGTGWNGFSAEATMASWQLSVFIIYS